MEGVYYEDTCFEWEPQAGQKRYDAHYPCFFRWNEEKAAVVTKPRLKLIRKAGRQYAEKGEIEASLLAEITSPMIPEDQYAAIVNKGV